MITGDYITPQIVSSIIVVFVAIIVFILIGTIFTKINKSVNVINSLSSKRMFTVIGRIIKAIFILIVIFIVFEINGINVTSLVASVGIVGAAATLAAQDIMKDILSGLYISGEKIFSPGDIVRYNSKDGEVVDFNLRSTKIRLFENDSIMYISNRNISEIIVLSDVNYFDLPMPYEVNVTKAENILNSVVEKSKGLEGLKNIEYLGVQNFNSSDISYRLRFECDPMLKGLILRQIRKIYLEILAKENLCVPYQKIEVINPDK